VLAGPLARYTQDAAAQLFAPAGYIDAVLGQTPQEAHWKIREDISK
jgi:hypothetical protein